MGRREKRQREEEEEEAAAVDIGVEDEDQPIEDDDDFDRINGGDSDDSGGSSDLEAIALNELKGLKQNTVDQVCVWSLLLVHRLPPNLPPSHRIALIITTYLSIARSCICLQLRSAGRAPNSASTTFAQASWMGSHTSHHVQVRSP